MMKRKLWTLLLALGAALALCVGASADGVTEVTDADALTGENVTLDGEYKLTADIIIDRSIVIKKDKSVTLDLNGYVLQYKNADKGSVIKVEGGGHLTIQDSNTGSLSHKFTPNSDGLWVLDETNGSETIPGGVITGGTGYPCLLYGNYYIYYGGGVYVTSGGTLTMTGGNIVGCSATYGGGVCIDPSNGQSAQFSMTSGSIAGCVASNSGGGVYARTGNTVFDMSGTAVIHDCRCGSSGGGVYAYDKFQMMGSAAIRNCTAESTTQGVCGGGVYVSSSSSFTMSGQVKIEDCQAISNSPFPSKGGGVYVTNNALLTLSGSAVIQKCAATNSAASSEAYGGGVSAANVNKITLEDNACITQCNAVNGSGLYITGVRNSPNDGKLYANGGSVNGDVVLGDDKDDPCTITGSGATEFNGKVTVAVGSTIEKGKFTGTVINKGTISGGEFTGTVINGEGGAITGGTFTVTFDTDGGSTVANATVSYGDKLTAPTTTKDGYTLDGWYYTKDDNTDAKWDFDNNKVTRTMTLKAKWVQTHTVIFDTNGGSAVDPVTVDDGSTVAKPADPTKSGYTFGGWYKDSTYENPYDFNAAVTGNLTLYAKWNAIVYSDPTYAVSAPTAENGRIAVSPRYAERGERVTVTVTPDEGYELESLTVTDSRGDAITLTDKGDGRYTFTMPARRVEVKASFVKTIEVSPFADVAIDAYCYEAVKWAQEKGITGGIGNDLFGPDQPCTRAQIVTFLWRAAGSPVVNYAMELSDVAEDVYYAEAVRWALSEGITTGAGESSFSPDAACTRAQAVTFLARALNAKASGKAEFSDVPTDSYFAEAVAWAAANGVTEGIGGGLFGSGNDCTRGQIVTFLYRAYNK